MIYTEYLITDGTDYIDLLRHFRMAGYKPGTLTYKDGGTFQGGMGDGRRLVQRYYNNVSDEMTMIVKAGCQSSAIADLRRLRQMLEAAADYWTADWNRTPVWIEARAPGDNARRYALIVAGIAPDDPDPYAQPFAGPLASFGAIQLNLEHLPWSDNAPGDSDAVPISVRQNDFGNIETVYLDLSYILQEVTDGTAFVNFCDSNYNVFDTSTDGPDDPVTENPCNQIEFVIVGGFLRTTATYPFGLNPGGAGGVYFGAQGAPFSNLVFNIATANTAIIWGDWEYWDGSAWAALPDIDDETDTFNNTGVNTVSWSLPDDWATRDMTSIDPIATADTYWVRIIPINGSPVTPPPTQDVRPIYTVNSPYVEIQRENIGGDIPALIKVRASSKRDTNQNSALFVAARSMDRGPAFSPYVGLTDENDPQGTYTQAYALNSDSGADILFEAYSGTPYGRRLVFAPDATDAESLLINFVGGGNRQLGWNGLFRVFARVYQPTGTAGDFKLAMRLGTSLGTLAFIGEYASVDSIGTDWLLLDLGLIDMPREYAYTPQLSLWKTTEDNVTLYVYDLIFMPVDEWAGEISYNAVSGGPLDPTTEKMATFVIDPISYPNQGVWAVTDVFDNTPVEPLPARLSAPGPSIIQKQMRTRLWFLGYYTDADGVTVSYPWDIMGVQVWKAERYQNLKGTNA